MVLISKSYEETVEEKVLFIHEMEVCCHKAFILYGPTAHNSSRNDPSLYLNSDSGAQRGKGKDILPYKGRVCFYTPTNVFNSVNS